MATVISLGDVIEPMEMQGDYCLSFLYPDTGDIVTTTKEERRLVEEPENLWNSSLSGTADGEKGLRSPDWQTYLHLPNRFEIHSGPF